MDWLEDLTTPLDGDLHMDAALDARDSGGVVLSILAHPRSIHLPREALDHCQRILAVDEPDDRDWRCLNLIADWVRGGANV